MSLITSGDRDWWASILTFHAQPVVNPASTVPIGYELLARWSYDHNEVMGPMFAFPLGADPDDTSRRALYVAAYVASHIDLPVGANVTEAVLTDPKVLNDTIRACADSLVAPSMMVVEVLETVPVMDPTVLAAIDGWKSAGFLVALDDYGTGHINAQTVLAARPNIVKTASELLRDRNDAALQEARDIAVSVGAVFAVEGVETADDAAYIRRFQPDAAQGYLYGKPAPLL